MTRQSIQWPPLRSEERVDRCAEAAFGLLAMKGRGQNHVQIGSLYICGEQNPQPFLSVYEGSHLVLSGHPAPGAPFNSARDLHCVPQPGKNTWQDRLVSEHNKAVVSAKPLTPP